MLFNRFKNFSFLILATLLGSALLTACGSDDGSFVQPSTEPAIIEEAETDGGCDLLAQEFGVECDNEAKNAQRVPYNGINTYNSRASLNKHQEVMTDKPHQFSSSNKEFPFRGSWRQTKAEILDIVDRYMWSPEEQKPVQLMKYFDMVLLLNVAPRDNLTPENNSSQKMQVYVRQGESNLLKDWKRIHIWNISSGLPGGMNGVKIATPTGVFKFDPSRMHESYKSAQFDFADMYESMFLYHQYAYQSGGQKAGVAIHGTEIRNKLGRRDSGGCVRLARENAQCLFYTLKGERSEKCLNGGKLNYWGRVPSFIPRDAEADPEYLSSGLLEVGGYRVLVAIFSDENDKL